MSRWFRWYEGTTEDGKFRMVARNASVTVATVMGVWAILLEDASHPDHRGVATRGEDFYAAVLDLDCKLLQTILEAMEDIGVISVAATQINITKWKERQFETDTTDATNAERQRRWREKHKSNVHERNRNGTVTETKRPDTDTDTDKKEDAALTRAPLDDGGEASLFARGKKILGPSAGGMVANLLRARGSVPLARAALELAATKHNPREYIGRVIAGHSADAPLSPIV